MHPKSEFLFQKIKRALDEQDVEGLLAIGAPADEYEDEARLIENGMCELATFGKRTADINAIIQIVEGVWNSKFGAFDGKEAEQRRPNYEAVARKIVG